MPAVEYSDARYLLAKRTVDDRALNKDVVERLRAEWSGVEAPVPCVVEVGAGLGTMVTRLLDWGLVTRAEWWLLDVDAELLSAARGWLMRWAEQREEERRLAPVLVTDGGSSVRIVSAHGDGIDVTVRTFRAELGELLTATASARELPPPADLVLAHAFLDLIDLPTLLPRLLELGTRQGLLWCSLNYDGDTILEPAHPADAAWLEIYNRSMDVRVRHGRPAGHSHTGRRLFGQLGAAGARVLAAGASDWVVHPDAGRYPFDEAYFLHHIIHTIAAELDRHAELDTAAVSRWVALRHEQIDAGELVYIAHQLDLLARR